MKYLFISTMLCLTPPDNSQSLTDENGLVCTTRVKNEFITVVCLSGEHLVQSLVGELGTVPIQGHNVWA